eukprot:gene21046-biopygen7103
MGGFRLSRLLGCTLRISSQRTQCRQCRPSVSTATCRASLSIRPERLELSTPMIFYIARMPMFKYTTNKMDYLGASL